MTSEIRRPIFLPEPQLIKFRRAVSRLSPQTFTGLSPTRAQMEELPDPIHLTHSDKITKTQAYILSILENRVEIEARDEIGWHYGLLTLKQVAQNCSTSLPQGSIEDWPDFENRGIMLDVSRNKVPKLSTLYYLIDLFAEWKINQLQLYIEHTFTYLGHKEVWYKASPLTRRDIKKLDDYCSDRFIELVPNLNCFGHMSRWLTHEQYRSLAENPNGGQTDFGFRKEPQGLCPIDPRSIALATDLIHQMAASFKSNQINVGCDETIDLGYGRSKSIVEKIGRGRVYLDYLKKIHGICEDLGTQMQFWADIILRYPNLAGLVPDNCVALNWGYEANHPFKSESSLLKQAGQAFYVCPGTSSWNSVGGRTENMVRNISSAAKAGVANGAIGFMVTDWGDNGHLQPLLSSFPGFVFGSSAAWNSEQSNDLDLLLDRHVFQADGWGKLLLDIGNLDQAIGISIHNNSILFKLLQESEDEIKGRTDLKLERLKDTLHHAKKLREGCGYLRATNPTQLILTKEFAWVIEMLIHACRRGIQVLGPHSLGSLHENAVQLRETHKSIWHARNRSGGYVDSRTLFTRLTES